MYVENQYLLQLVLWKTDVSGNDPLVNVLSFVVDILLPDNVTENRQSICHTPYFSKDKRLINNIHTTEIK